MVNRRLEAVVTADIRQFQSAMSMVGVSANAAAGAAIAAFTAVIGTVSALSRATLDASEKFETLRTRLQLLNGDMRRGAEEFEMIRQRAKFSSFETDKLIDSYIRLKALAGERFATQHLESIGFAARIAGQDMATMSNRVGELVMRIETGLTPGLLKRSLRTFATAFGRDGVRAMIDLVDAGASADVIIKELEKSLSRFGNTAKQAIEESAAGRMAKLQGVVTDMLAVGGEGEQLENYKEVLTEITNILMDIQETDAFRALSDSFAELWANILLLIQSDGFKAFLVDTIKSLKVMADLISIIIKGINIMANLNAAVPGALGATGAIMDVSQALAGADPGAGIQQMEAARNARGAAGPQKVIVVNGNNENAYA